MHCGCRLIPQWKAEGQGVIKRVSAAPIGLVDNLTAFPILLGIAGFFSVPVV